MLFHSLGGNLLYQRRIILGPQSNQSDIGAVAFIAAAGVRDLAKLDTGHFRHLSR
jgi:hypothetical protein